MLVLKCGYSKKDKIKGLILPNNYTPNLAYLCGIFAGDGSINIRESKNDYFLKCVGNPKDEKPLYFDVIGPLFKETFGFLPNIKLYDGETTFGFVVYSRALIYYLIDKVGLPYGKKYDKLCIPKIFLRDERLLIPFLRGLFDTDGCVSFKRRHKTYPYYPVISLYSKSEPFLNDVTLSLRGLGFRVYGVYNYKKKDIRVKIGYTTISAIEIHGVNDLKLWTNKIGFWSLKHNNKIKLYWKE
ncbi:hypothetical protein HYT57_05055 [Candidatus Woesearchaeota archaeon]|nr:hypothetical protein [Candidatus Woesearchaeota archaeon]